MERWKDIPNYEGYYQASNQGKIRSLDRVIVREDGHMTHLKGVILQPSTTSKGYLLVGLSKKGIVTSFTVHSLILRVFVGPPPKGMQARHYPLGDKTNNKLENLRYGTPSQNQEDRWEQGTRFLPRPKPPPKDRPRGEAHGMSKLTERKVKTIRKLRKNGWTLKETAKKFKVHFSLISLVDRRLIWAHVL